MQPKLLKSLQSMRIFAALGVLQYHLWHNYLGVDVGHPGTDFFLILVGVVAAYSQAKRIANGNWWEYIRDRYKRLYVTFVPLFVITALVKWEQADPGWILKSFFFMPTADRLPVIGSTWMLSMFMVFYFLFSLCFVVKTEKIIWGIFGAWLISILAYNTGRWSSNLPQEWSNLLFAERNIDFILGYVVGVIVRNHRLESYHATICLWTGFAGLIAGTILLNTGFAADGRTLIVGLPIAIFVLGIATLEQNNVDHPLVRFLTSPAMVWLGGTSYVLYLSHGMFLQAWSLFLPVTSTLVVPITLGAILAAAVGYAFWEAPVLLYLKSGKWLIPQLPTLRAAPERQAQSSQ